MYSEHGNGITQLIAKSNKEAGKNAVLLEATDILFVATYILSEEAKAHPGLQS
jgi:hypothetical protein